MKPNNFSATPCLKKRRGYKEAKVKDTNKEESCHLTFGIALKKKNEFYEAVVMISSPSYLP